MKINWKVRIKNPWFWVALVGVILTAMGISPETFTSWGAVWDAIKALFMNPYLLGCVILSVLGVFIDPTTKGVSDSDQAMTYTEPKAKG